MKSYLLLIGLFVLASCDINNSTGSDFDDARDAQDKWLAYAPSDYTYNFRTVCFCVFTEEVLVVVENDSVTGVLDLNTLEPVKVQIGDEIYTLLEVSPSSFFTITEFFERILVQIPIVDDVEASYNGETGMPITVYFDRLENAVDDEITYQFSNLQVN